MGRSTVIDALRRLSDAGVITIEARHARNGAKIANDYRLGDCAFERNSCVQKGDPPVQDSNTHSSQRHLIPIGNQLRKASNRYGSAKDSPGEDRADQAAKLSGESAPRADWDDLATWLYRQGKYTEQWGFGARALAVDDLERLRREKSHGPLLRAIEIAKSKRLYGEVLISFLENPTPRVDEDLPGVLRVHSQYCDYRVQRRGSHSDELRLPSGMVLSVSVFLDTYQVIGPW